MSTTTSSLTESKPDRLDRYRSWPDLSYRFGLGWEELARMPRWLRALYMEALPRLQAEDQSSSIEAASYPNFKQDAQRSVQRRLRRRMGVSEEKKSFASEEDMGEQLQRASIPLAVHLEPEGGEE